MGREANYWGRKMVSSVLALLTLKGLRNIYVLVSVYKQVVGYISLKIRDEVRSRDTVMGDTGVQVVLNLRL